MLKFLKKVDFRNYSIYKIFDVRNKKLLISRVNVYSEGFFGQNEDYSEDIDKLEIDVIKTIRGECQKRELKTNDAIRRIVHPKAVNNNCFFKCIQPFVPQLQEKILKSECNKIRQGVGIKDNSEIDIQTATKIFEEYSQTSLEIWTDDTLLVQVDGSEPTLRLSLKDNHYSILTLKEIIIEQCCPECGRKFKFKHKCNTNGIVYKKSKEGKNRYVMNSLIPDELNYDKSNDNIAIVYYDIETHTRITSGGSQIHTPYIVGFVDSITNEFQYFADSDCMERFILHLASYHEKSKIYLNAYNGSKFDHYEFIKQLN
jgi:hypothetical protein